MPSMPKRKYDDKLYIDMPFEEAVERFIGVKPEELKENLDKQKRKRKTPGSGRKPPGANDAGQVVRLRDKRKPPNH